MKFIVATILAFASLAAADDFTISYWCGPPAKFTTLERYKEIKDAKAIPLNEQKYMARRDSERDAEKEEEKRVSQRDSQRIPEFIAE